jgi:tRNA nucleotidyltransferase (CCA-adding enzyme)
LESLSGYNPYLRYSEHPYVEAIVDKVKINIVGCFDVKQGEWRSSADRSPYHTVMIQSKFDTNLRGQSRLLKRFLKSNSIYGAEIQTQGFSGYVCEVLILRFGSFMGVVRMAQDLGKNSVIALEEDHYKYSSLHRSSLIILDPVDPHRNLGAAISKQNVARFILASHCFIQRPLLRYFLPGRISTKIQKHEVFQNQLVMAKFQHTERSADILWGQLRRTITRVEKQLTIKGFRVLRSSAATDNKTKSALLLLLERTELDPIAVKRGPEVSMIDGAKVFLKKNFINSRMTWIGVDGKLYVSDIRHSGDIVSHLKELLTSGISSSGVAPRLTKQLAETLKIVKGPKVLVESERNVWLKEALVDVIGTDIVICSPA